MSENGTARRVWLKIGACVAFMVIMELIFKTNRTIPNQAPAGRVWAFIGMGMIPTTFMLLYEDTGDFVKTLGRMMTLFGILTMVIFFSLLVLLVLGGLDY